MPQLNFENPLTIAQVVWMALIFGALYLLLAQWALPQVASVLDERAMRISTDLDRARLAKAAADAAVEDLRLATRSATTEAQAAIASSVAEAKAGAAEQARISDVRLEEQLTQAELRIQAARESAMSALRDVAAETAATIVHRLTGQSPDQSLVRHAVNNALVRQG